MINKSDYANPEEYKRKYCMCGKIKKGKYKQYLWCSESCKDDIINYRKKVF